MYIVVEVMRYTNRIGYLTVFSNTKREGSAEKGLVIFYVWD